MEGQTAPIVRGAQEIFESLNICLKKSTRKFLKLIRRYKEILAEVSLWSSGRQPQILPKAMPLLWTEVGRCTCYSSLESSWFGWNSQEGRGPICRCQSPGIVVWPVLTPGQYIQLWPFHEEEGRKVLQSHPWPQCRYIFPCATIWSISSALCYCEDKSTSTLTFSLPHRPRIEKIKWIRIKGSKVITLIFTIFNSAPSRSLI